MFLICRYKVIFFAVFFGFFWASGTRLSLAKKAQLVIIMDDMINQRQLRQAQALDLTLNYAFIPPSKNNPNSAKVASQLNEYLVHLPLEAVRHHNAEIGTLKTTDSEKTINQRIQQIKQQFPKAIYVNNHTGSRFTADKSAMTTLLYSLQQVNLHFVDSRTTHETVANSVSHDLGLPLLSRDVFLDHTNDKESIVAAIKKSVRVAHEKGYAIAIAHPRPETLAVMRQYRHLFDSVELVSINSLSKSQQTDSLIVTTP